MCSCSWLTQFSLTSSLCMLFLYFSVYICTVSMLKALKSVDAMSSSGEIIIKKNSLRSGIRCCVSICKASKRRTNLKFFKFPAEHMILGKIWREKCQIGPEIKKKLFICENHFLSEHMGKKYLIAEAVPTLNLRREEEVKEEDKIDKVEIEVKHIERTAVDFENVENNDEEGDEDEDVELENSLITINTGINIVLLTFSPAGVIFGNILLKIAEREHNVNIAMLVSVNQEDLMEIYGVTLIEDIHTLD